MPTTTRKFTGSRHTGYVVENDHGAVVATVCESRGPSGGYLVRLFTSPDDYTIQRERSLIGARDIAELHAARMS